MERAVDISCGCAAPLEWAAFEQSATHPHPTPPQPDPKAAILGAAKGAAALVAIKLVSASRTSNAQPVGRVVCYNDWRSGVVTGFVVNNAPVTCSAADTETPVNLGAQDYISDVDVALVKATTLVGRVTFTIKNAAGLPTRFMSCGRVPESLLDKALAKTTAGVRAKVATGRLAGIKAGCLPTGPLTVAPLWGTPILEDTASPSDPRIGIVEGIKARRCPARSTRARSSLCTRRVRAAPTSTASLAPPSPRTMRGATLPSPAPNFCL